MNILYRMDLKICDWKSEFWTKTEYLDFQINEKSILVSTIDFWACFQDQNYFKKYSGVFRNHPGSVSIYKNIIFKEIRLKSGKYIKLVYKCVTNQVPVEDIYSGAFIFRNLNLAPLVFTPNSPNINTRNYNLDLRAFQYTIHNT